MIDYFALLDQPRVAWLDPEQLKQAFHTRTLQSHPDAQGDEAQFAQLNEAYQVLRDPKRRLQHLLALRGEAANAGRIPPDVEALFPAIARLTRQADVVVAKHQSATNGLARSLVRQELIDARAEVEEMVTQLDQLLASANEQLRNRDADLSELFLRFSYLTRWLAELKEKQLQLSC
ncbi:MAG TPA: DnaJ domain-containing protein [Chthoniobacterales bacterium]